MGKMLSPLEKITFGILLAGAITLGVMKASNVDNEYMKKVANPLLGVGVVNYIARATSKYPKE